MLFKFGRNHAVNRPPGVAQLRYAGPCMAPITAGVGCKKGVRICAFQNLKNMRKD
jgi:hypothetical protein